MGRTGVNDLASRFIEATPAASGDEAIDDESVRCWREQGYAFVAGLLPQELIGDLLRSASGRFPAAGSPEAQGIGDFGSGGRLTFPAMSRSFNAVTLHPRLLAAVARLLGIAVSELRLSQSDLWPKYGRRDGTRGEQDNSDQRIHVDYPNHTLTHPPRWDRPEAVELILYLGDIDECGGPTAVVPRRGPSDPAYRWPIVDTPGIAELDYVNDREHAERYFAKERPELADWRKELYARERYTRFRPGDVLFYRHDTWHRGTPMNEGALRLVQNVTFRKAAAEWVSTLHVGWAWSMYRKNKFLERLIAELSPEARAVLGFPMPESDD